MTCQDVSKPIQGGELPFDISWSCWCTEPYHRNMILTEFKPGFFQPKPKRIIERIDKSMYPSISTDIINMGALPFSVAIPASEKSVSPSHCNCFIYLKLKSSSNQMSIFTTTAILAWAKSIYVKGCADCARVFYGPFRKPWHVHFTIFRNSQLRHIFFPKVE